MARAGYALDTRQNGFGLIRLPYYAQAVFCDPEFDSLHLVLLENAEPTHESLPEASTAPTPDGVTIYEFDAAADSRMVYRWRGKLNLMPRPVALRVARVFAETYANVVMNVYANGVLLKTKLLASSRSFKLPAKKDYETYEVEFIGTSTVRLYEAGERMGEHGEIA